MKILYIHGFASYVNYNSDKYLLLSTIGEVTCVAPDYTKGYEEVFNEIVNISDGYDLIVGTSMGGYMAALIGEALDIPSVLINPAIDPSISLLKYLGHGTTYDGKDYVLTKDIVKSYSPLSNLYNNLILLDMGDEVLDNYETARQYSCTNTVRTFEGGSHRFDHMKESIDEIELFMYASRVSSGFGDY